MKTTLILKEDLVREAMEMANVTEKTAVVHLGLEALIEKLARQKLIDMGGKDKKAKGSNRRRL